MSIALIGRHRWSCHLCAASCPVDQLEERERTLVRKLFQHFGNWLLKCSGALLTFVASHSGSLVEYQCISGQWNITPYHAIPYNPGKYDNLTNWTVVRRKPFFKVEEARQLPKPFTIRSCLEQLRSLRYLGIWCLVKPFTIWSCFSLRIMVIGWGSSYDNVEMRIIFSRTLHSNHVLVMLLKQRFLFTFSIGLKKVKISRRSLQKKLPTIWSCPNWKVRDLSPEQRLRLAPLFLAQEKYCRCQSVFSF